MPTNLVDMDHYQKTAWACRIILDGLKNDRPLSDSVAIIVSGIHMNAFERGREQGRRDVLHALPKKRKAKRK